MYTVNQFELFNHTEIYYTYVILLYRYIEIITIEMIWVSYCCTSYIFYVVFGFSELLGQ